MITPKDVEHVAKLARLALSEEEKRIYTEQLGRILDLFGQLNEIDTDGVEPMSHPLPVVNVLRDDIVKDPSGHELLLATAPDSETAPDGKGGYFRVPKIG
ncbi:MAG: Asp-tRNA(Asn)/Glu-tRNA(Gln) amidotransferase subunit GatC [Candidatus Obscuribacterales bacterium]|nr:Asp-tRNA(Asn)/Glu-tRNA(Gln) amidotransferase subunit GatC [Candidatus Obscuribacterales bacterium]